MGRLKAGETVTLDSGAVVSIKCRNINIVQFHLIEISHSQWMLM